MRLRRFALASCLSLLALAGCAMNDDTGAPDPGAYWGWACPDGGTPVEASAPIDYVASGTCGRGGPLSVSVNGCDMFGGWSALGLSSVKTVRYASSPGRGGWIITGTAAGADGEATDAGKVSSLTCSASPASAGDLTITCSSATGTTCRSTLTPSRSSH